MSASAPKPGEWIHREARAIRCQMPRCRWETPPSWMPEDPIRRWGRHMRWRHRVWRWWKVEPLVVQDAQRSPERP